MSDFVQLIGESIRAKRLFRRGQLILVAVSGGLDSMVLLHVLHRLAATTHWRLVVAHFNHQLRGRGSDGDERFVRQAAEQLELPFLVARANVKQFARAQKLSVEMAARRLRHDFLARTARERDVMTIALAHHADDQVELFFLRLLRGAGAEGLAGMKWTSPSPSDAALALARPLLGRSKAELRQFALQERIVFREDATNASFDILRNRVRHELLPLLQKQYQPALVKTTLRAMELLTAEADLVTRRAEAWWRRERRSGFGRLPLAVQRRSVVLQLIRLGVKPDFDLVERLRAAVEQPVMINPALRLYRTIEGEICIVRSGRPEFDPHQTIVKLSAGQGSDLFGRLRINWRIEAGTGSAVPSRKSASVQSEYFDAERVGSRIMLRHWQPGDRFQPIGMTASVKLQDCFSNLKIPRTERHRLVVAATAQGEVFWVEGLRISESFKLERGTVRRLKWEWQRIG